MSRRLARETALQVLYQIDIAGDTASLENSIEQWAREFSLSEKRTVFTRELVAGTLRHKEAIDQKLMSTAHDWALDRMNAVDRNLMRLALYEMLFCPEIPQRVTLNEAIEIAKRFGGDDSAKFINGILDKFIENDQKE